MLNDRARNEGYMKPLTEAREFITGTVWANYS